MSEILAIPCKDRITVASDGRIINHTNPYKPPLDVPKMFQITNNSVLLIAGDNLRDELAEYINNLVKVVRANGNTDIADIALGVKKQLGDRLWAAQEDGDTGTPHLEALVAGYSGTVPTVYAITGDGICLQTSEPVFGVWEDAQCYLACKVSTKHQRNEGNLADKIAIEILTMAELHHPKEVGGSHALWHIFPDRIERLTSKEINQLLQKHAVRTVALSKKRILTAIESWHRTH